MATTARKITQAEMDELIARENATPRNTALQRMMDSEKLADALLAGDNIEEPRQRFQGSSKASYELTAAEMTAAMDASAIHGDVSHDHMILELAEFFKETFNRIAGHDPGNLPSNGQKVPFTTGRYLQGFCYTASRVLEDAAKRVDEQTKKVERAEDRYIADEITGKQLDDSKEWLETYKSQHDLAANILDALQFVHCDYMGEAWKPYVKADSNADLDRKARLAQIELDRAQRAKR